MWLRITRQVFVGGAPVFVGDVVEVSARDGASLLAARRGVEVPPPSLAQDGGGADSGESGEWLPDRLTAIRGIGAKTQEALNGLGVWTFQQLAAADADALAAALDGSSVGQVRRWQSDAIGFLG